MKLSQVVFIHSVRDIVSARSVTSFVSAESPTRADGYGYELEAGDAGVFAKHPLKPGVERFIPWSNVTWGDAVPEVQKSWADVAGAELVDGGSIEVLKPKAEHWKTRQKREREAAKAAE